MNISSITHQDIITFWFKTLEPKQWFIKDAALDKHITQHFDAIHDAAWCGELYMWRKTPEGRLAEIIVLDQFPRNMFRDTAKAFASDNLALILAQGGNLPRC